MKDYRFEQAAANFANYRKDVDEGTKEEYGGRLINPLKGFRAPSRKPEPKPRRTHRTGPTDAAILRGDVEEFQIRETSGQRDMRDRAVNPGKFKDKVTGKRSRVAADR